MTAVRTPREHFVTLHDEAFLPIALSLYSSLVKHAPNAHLTIVCMDEQTAGNYAKLKLPNLTAVAPHQWLNKDLSEVKQNRSQREFCWTMASHSFDVAWRRHPEAERLTYLDADLFFFDTPNALLDNLRDKKKSILITEHAFAPEYDQTAIAGKFCVQFVTFTQSTESLAVLNKWQSQCIERCSETPTADGHFGDQVYLDTWQSDYPDQVHVYDQIHRTIAPWNVYFLSQQCGGRLSPVFYHFHGLRLSQGDRALLWKDYVIGEAGETLYSEYLRVVAESLKLLKQAGIVWVPRQERDNFWRELLGWLRFRTNSYGQRRWVRLAMYE